MPDRIEARAAIAQWAIQTDSGLLDALALLFEGHSFSEMERTIMLARRAAAMQNEPLENHLRNLLVHFARTLPRKSRGAFATKLVTSGRFSQREAHDLTGVSRDTIRKAQKVQNLVKE